MEMIKIFSQCCIQEELTLTLELLTVNMTYS